jgi:hypothetical protein
MSIFQTLLHQLNQRNPTPFTLPPNILSSVLIANDLQRSQGVNRLSPIQGFVETKLIYMIHWN